MSLFKSVQRWIWQIGEIFVPEDTKIKSLLNLEPDLMRNLLPKSAVYSKDIVVLFDYQNKVVRFLIKSIKYKNNFSLRKRVALYLYEELLDIASDVTLFYGSSPLLLPMPMSDGEKRGRGFNQCEEIVSEIKKLSGENIETSFVTLNKTRETDRQTTLSRQKREINVRNSMYADKKTVQGRVCIVLDDVFTTGATLKEARRALMEAGSKCVIGLFIAH